MKPNLSPILKLNSSGLGCLLTLVLLGFFLISVGLGWIVNGFLIFLALLLFLPAIAWWVFREWLRRNLIIQPCPVCGNEVTTLKKSKSQCLSCGESLEVKEGKLVRATPPGTIDVTVIDE